MSSPIVYGMPNVSTVSEVRGGLQMPVPLPVAAIGLHGSIVPNVHKSRTAAAGSPCPSYSEPVFGTTVRFGHDVSSGCVLKLNRTALRSLCCQGSTDNSCVGSHSNIFAAQTGVPYFFSPASVFASSVNISGVVGVYGNADPLDKNQWIAISQPVLGAARVWNDITGTCLNMVSGLHFKFVVAKTGEKSNPQNKIVSAQASYSMRDWVSRVPYEDQVSLQAFSLSVTVSFVFREYSDFVGYAPPPPPRLFSLPRDVVYPFNIAHANSAHKVASVSAIIVVWTLMFTVLLISDGFF